MPKFPNEYLVLKEQRFLRHIIVFLTGQSGSKVVRKRTSEKRLWV